MATIEIKGKTDHKRMRRIALEAQGLTKNAPFGRGLAGAQRAIEHLGYVQIDTISVVERAHHHVLRSRVPNYQPAMLHTLLGRGSIYEYWSHAAAFMPMCDFRFSLPYKNLVRAGKTPWTRSKDTKLMRDVKRRIESEGALRSRDLEDTRTSKSGWWDWKPSKRAIEQLFMQGDLMVCARDGFEKTYDLTERILPAEVDSTLPSTEEFATHLLDQQLRCHGFASLKGITYLRRDADLRKATKKLIQQHLSQETLDTLTTADGTTFYGPAGCLEQKLPTANNKLRILSPFDNTVIQRERLSSLFNFDYQIECYVPEAKRQFGYFCLPLLHGDEFIGRMDCKAHRAKKMLELKAVHLHDHAATEMQVHQALAESIADFRKFQGCDNVTLTNTRPKQRHAPLQAVLDQHV